LHPSEEGKFVFISFSSNYTNEDNSFDASFNVDVRWETPHECNDECDEWNCDRETDYHDRPATLDEVIGALKIDLKKQLSKKEAELTHIWQLAKSLPTEEELTKIRRRVEDHLRKHPRDIPAVAKLLKLL